MSQASRPKPEPVCSQCGQPDPHAVGDEILSAACCHVRGSCGAVRESEDAEPVVAPPLGNDGA